MKNEKIVIILLLALILIAGGAVYILYPDSIRSTPPEPVRNDGYTEEVATKPTEALKKESSSYLGRDGLYVVKYTNTGFVPKQLQIPKGKGVRFINMSDAALRVYSDDQTNPKFTELNEAKSIGNGGTYTFSFVQTGIWAFHNQTHPTHRANILVY